jgi:hypothetical protein
MYSSVSTLIVCDNVHGYVHAFRPIVIHDAVPTVHTFHLITGHWVLFVFFASFTCKRICCVDEDEAISSYTGGSISTCNCIKQQ